jgi:hypothetical protein
LSQQLTKSAPDHCELDYTFVIAEIACVGYNSLIDAEFKPGQGRDTAERLAGQNLPQLVYFPTASGTPRLELCPSCLKLFYGEPGLACRFQDDHFIGDDSVYGGFQIWYHVFGYDQTTMAISMEQISLAQPLQRRRAKAQDAIADAAASKL